MKRPLCIYCAPEDLDQGLFGNVLTHPFQVLPYLHQQGIYPAWEIRSQHYGDAPDFISIPGAVDLSYEAPAGPYRRISLNELRRRHGQILGGDWQALARIWNAYFRIPARVLERADQVVPRGSSRALGVHYRGTDKQINAWDSNPITQQQYLLLIQDYLAQKQESFDRIFVGTDEPSFVAALRTSVDLPVHDLGAVEFHMAAEHSMSRAEKTDRAMADCVVFSRCDAVIQTSSALPSFAKLFNPALPIYRCAASKLFSNMPYFPVAYIPVLPVTRASSKEILEQTMQADWETHPEMARFLKPFVAHPRWPRNDAFFKAAGKLGVEELAAKYVTGYR